MSVQEWPKPMLVHVLIPNRQSLVECIAFAFKQKFLALWYVYEHKSQAVYNIQIHHILYFGKLNHLLSKFVTTVHLIKKTPLNGDESSDKLSSDENAEKFKPSLIKYLHKNFLE